MTHKHIGHLLSVGHVSRHVTDEAPLTEYGNAVREFLDLVHLVSDDDDGLSAVSHVAEDRKKLLGLLRSEDSCRLVKDEYVCAAVESLEYLYGLLLRNGHVIDLLSGVKFKTVFLAELSRLLAYFTDIELPGLLDPENDVLCSGKNLHELVVLVDHPDAVFKRFLRRTDVDFLVVDIDVPFVRTVDAGQDVHESGLPAAVLAQQSKYLASVYIEPDLVICHDRAEGLGNISHFYGNCFL